MNKTIFKQIFLLLAICFFAPFGGFAQITSVANANVPTEYSSGVQDNIYVFCGQKDVPGGSLTATYPDAASGAFEWQKYNASTGTFDFFSSDMAGTTSSTISNLTDGCYRVKLTGASGDIFYTAWVFNDYITAAAEIPESDCTSFTLNGTFDSPAFTYADLSNNQPIILNKDIQVKWMNGDVVVTRFITSQVFDPPTKDTQYTLDVSDKFGCVGSASVTYISIVTKASFSYSTGEQKAAPFEAPLTVTFTNTSENGDAGKYEWIISKDLSEISKEKEAGTFKDSIKDILYNDNPVYIFENVGEYKVKLVSKHVSEFTTCVDTFYMNGTIKTDSAFIDAPNVFTPNGDGNNDKFVVKFFSMKSVKITIFNRWGKVLHVWQSGDVRGFTSTIASVPQSVWDGRVGGQLATPGVYYYVADGIGRDGFRRRASGFFHLFRGQ